jgi:hypothetical protein
VIVRRNGSSRLLITQPDHAALAARVMREWRADGLLGSPRRQSILLAVEEHDNGWLEVDAAPLVDAVTGRVLDFIGAPDDVRRSVWPRGVARLAASPYAAALVAQHALHIYRRYRDNPGWAPFFAGIETRRDRHLQSTAFSLDDLFREYFFLRIGDLVSLTFCNGWTDAQLDDSGSGYAIRLEGTRLTIAPDPFEGREVHLEIAARELPDGTFRSADDARDAWSKAPQVLVHGVALGSRSAGL